MNSGNLQFIIHTKRPPALLKLGHNISLLGASWSLLGFVEASSRCLEGLDVAGDGLIEALALLKLVGAELGPVRA